MSPISQGVTSDKEVVPILVDKDGGVIVSEKTHVLLDGTINSDTLAAAAVRGGIIRGNSTPKWSLLALGSANEILSSDGSDVKYQTLAALLANAVLTANGDIVYRDIDGTVKRLPIGSVGQVLTVKSNGALEWTTISGGYTQGSRCRSSSNQVISNGVETPLTFNTEIWDTDTIHDLVTNPSRFTCRTKGIYICFGSVAFPPNSTGYRTISITKNTVVVASTVTPAPSAVYYSQPLAQTIIDLEVDDYVEISVYQTSGGNLNSEAAGVAYPIGAIQRVG